MGSKQGSTYLDPPRSLASHCAMKADVPGTSFRGLFDHPKDKSAYLSIQMLLAKLFFWGGGVAQVRPFVDLIYG